MIPVSNYSTRISHSTLEKLKTATAAGNIEEVQKMLRQLEWPSTDPNELYETLYLQYADLEEASIARPQAAEKYSVPIQRIADWEKRGLVRVVEKAKRRGMPTTVNERDVATMAGVNKELRTKKGGPIPGFQPPIRQLAS